MAEPRFQQLSTLSPQQVGLQQQLGNIGLQGIQSYNPRQFDFGPIRQQALQNFQTQGIPSIAQRFEALGSGPQSSNFLPSISSARANLDLGLAALQQQFGMQQQGYDLQRQGQYGNFLGQALQPNFENLIMPPQTGAFGQFANALAPGLGTAAGLYALGGLGGVAGGAAGTAAGLTGMAALGPIGLGAAGGAGLYALIQYLINRNREQ